MLFSDLRLFTYRELVALVSPTFIGFLAMALLFTALDAFPDAKCTPQPPWWRNKSIKVDLFYVIFGPLFKVLLRFAPVAILVVPMLFFMPIEKIYFYLANGRGPIGGLSIPGQCFIFLFLSDFLLYWSHRLFHGKFLWNLHIIHHTPCEPDWTTAYRFHPLNLVLGPWLVTTCTIFLGTSPKALIFLAPLEAAMAIFVHANLNVTLGPLKYVIATPVFHRWHHTLGTEGGNMNFGAIFTIWDIIFGTFYFPEDRLPMLYGVPGDPVQESFARQLLHPFLMLQDRIKGCFWRRF